jgi:hypothetical protein
MRRSNRGVLSKRAGWNPVENLPMQSSFGLLPGLANSA